MLMVDIIPMIVVNLLINIVSDAFGQYSISTGQDFIYATTLLIAVVLYFWP
jgi:hypothetical protein